MHVGTLDSNRNSLIAFLVLALLFIAVEFRGLNHIDPSDDAVYYYMGKLVADGYMPYRDFFFAHPPLLIAFPSLLYALFGFKIAFLKSIELLAALGSAFITFLIARHLFNNRVAVTAVFLFLSAKLVLFESTYYLGMNLAVLLFLIGLYFALVRESYILAGFFMALSALTRLNLLPVIAAYAVFLFIYNRKQSWRFSLTFASMFVFTNLIFLMVAGPAFIKSVYLFHLLKPAQQATNLAIFLDFIKENTFLVATFLLFLFAPKPQNSENFGSRKSADFLGQKVKLFLVFIAVYFTFLAFSNKIFNFYLLFQIPFLALAGSYALNHIWERFRNDNLVRYSIVGVLAIVLIVNTSAALTRLYTFDFVEFQAFDELKAHIIEQTKPGDTLFGDANTASLLALATGRDIALNFPDTNIQVFQSNVVSLEDTINKLKASPPAAVIIRPTRGIGALEQFAGYLEQNCRLERHAKDPLQGDFLVYGCR